MPILRRRLRTTLLLALAFLLAADAFAQRPRQRRPAGGQAPPPPAEKAPPPPTADPAHRAALRKADAKLRAYATAEARRAIQPIASAGTADVLTALGRVLEQEKDYKAAEARLRRAAELDPKAAEPWLHLGEMLARQQKEGAARAAFAEAERRARAVLKSGSSSAAEARYHLGVALRGQDRFAASRASLEQAIQIDPKAVLPVYELGVCEAHAQNWQKAVDLLTQALQMDEGLAYAYFYRGQAAAQVGRKDLLISDLRRFLALAPDSPEAAVAARILAATRR